MVTPKIAVAALLTGALAVLPPVTLAAQGPSAFGQRGPSPLGWRLTLDAGTQSESNARFLLSGGVADVITRANGELAGTIGGSRGRLELLSNADVLRYRELTDLDRLNYSFGVRGAAAVTSRLSLGADAFFRSASSLDVGPTTRDENGDLLLLPYSMARTTAVASTARYRLSPTAEGTAEVSYTKSSFDSNDIIGGSVVVGRMGVRRRYSTSTTVGLLADASFTSTGNRSIDVGSLSGEWSAGTLPYQLRLRAGASGMGTSDFAGVTVVPIGEAELRRAARSGTFGAHYRRGAVEALGLGRPLSSDEVGLTHERIWWASVSVRASADHAWLEDPTRSSGGGGAGALTTSSVNAEARRTFGRGLWVAVGGFLRRRSQEAVVQNNGVFLNAGFTRQR